MIDCTLPRTFLPGGVRLFGVAPGIFLGLLEAERDALGLGVVLEDADGDLVAHLEKLRRVVDAAPAHVRDVEQAVDAAEVDEGAVLGDVLDDALDDLALLEGQQRLGLLLVALLLEEHAARQNDVAALLVELDDLELVGLPDQLVQVADGPKIDLGAGQERLHAATDGDREAALHALADGPFDELVALARGRDLIPDLHLVRFLLGKHDEPVVVLATLDVDVHLIAGLDRGLSLGVGELAEGDDAFALAADVDDDVVALHGDDRALDDFAFFAEIAGADARFEERGETVGGVTRRLLRFFACGAQGTGVGRHGFGKVLDGPRCVHARVGWSRVTGPGLPGFVLQVCSRGSQLQRTDQSS